LAKAGRDWHCKFCGAANIASDEKCAQCGASHRDPLPPVAPDPVPIHRTYTPQPEPPPPENLGPEPFKFPEIPADAWKWGAGVLLILGLVLGGFWFFSTREIQVSVTGFSWSRDIQIEAYRTVTESGWSLPPGGRLVSSEQRIESYDHVLDHYETRTWTTNDRVQTGQSCHEEDSGNGFSEDVCTPTYSYEEHTHSEQVPVYRDDPVYGTWYTYNIEKWVPDYVAHAGANDHKPFWPAYSIGANQRVGLQTQGYTAYLIDQKESKKYQVSLDEARWDSLSIGQRLTASVNQLGIVMSIKELQNASVTTD